MKVKRKSNYRSFLGLSLTLGVCLMSLSVAAQEIAVVDNVTEPTPVDFPSRSSLSEMKEAPFPSLSDSVIKEPTPMERVVSKKEAPSEQLLGRITSEVFHEMADLERGNVFLQLQAQREELKNNLEALKAQYRQARLEEIEKRENIIRTRVKWQQEQERIRQEILEKQLETELLEKKLENAEMEKEDLLPLDEDIAKAEKENAKSDEKEELEKEQLKTEEPEKVEFSIAQIIDIKGMKGRLTARVIDNTGKSLTLKNEMTLPSGHVVKEINKTDITLEKDGTVQVFNIEELANAPTLKEETSVENN